MVKLTSIAAGVPPSLPVLPLLRATTTLSPSDERVNWSRIGSHPTGITQLSDCWQHVFNYGDFTRLFQLNKSPESSLVSADTLPRLRPAISSADGRTEHCYPK
ncbi:ANE_G0052300.mRNA.1.CDS.1 [Saccharomyces cerevisiae]|nr:ANE_G0052300.mRNA.1.CDS.1 [Saccharomyces cerevisiae]CAI6894076.1 ANE_G0052300.mRNA.1.CDS.1 [Saccharomyces cerevisiae]